MNEYPNSIRNNMVNTEPYRNNYNIDIESLPEVNMSYSVQRGSSHKIRSAIIAAVIAASAFGYVTAISYMQHQSMIQNSTVVATEPLPEGATLNVTENPDFSYITTSNGTRVSNFNGIEARDLAKSYSQNSDSIGRQM